MKSTLVRAAMLGLGLGILLGGGLLLYLAWQAHAGGVDCTRLSPNECAFQSEAMNFLARRQAMGGGALMLLGFATFLLLRRQPAPPSEPGGPPRG